MVKGTPLKRLKITKTWGYYHEGEVRYVTTKEAEFLLNNGYAIQSKDMTVTDYKQKEFSDGNSSGKRIN